MHVRPKRGRKPAAIPSYRLHKASGQAVVTISGRAVYLGPYGSDDSRKKYAEQISAVAAGTVVDPLIKTEVSNDPGLSIAELCSAFLSFAEKHYVKNGKQTDEVGCYESLIDLLNEPFGLLPVDEFRPNQLRAVRELMIQRSWSRGYINRQINRLRHMVKWGVGRDLVEPNVLDRLRAVEPLMVGKSTARETKPRRAVSAEDIGKVKAKIRSKKAKDLMDLQLLTAARPGELLGLSTEMIDRSGPVWLSQLENHKTQHFGKSRILAFGPQAQEVLRKYLREDSPNELLFGISRNSYETVVRRACDRAGVPRFVPHELRHTAGTRYHDELGFEAARAMLGHSRPDTTSYYTNHMAQKAANAAGKLG